MVLPSQALARHGGLHALADTLRRKGDLTGALGRYREAMDVARALLEVKNASAGMLAALALTQQSIGDVLIAQGDLPAALVAWHAELDLRRRIAGADAGDPQKREQTGPRQSDPRNAV